MESTAGGFALCVARKHAAPQPCHHEGIPSRLPSQIFKEQELRRDR